MKKEAFIKHEERMDRKKVKFVNFLSFLMGLGSSSLVYVISGYIEKRTGNENVGIYFTLSYLFILLLLLNFHKIVNRYGKATIFFVFQFIKILVLVSLLFSPASGIGVSLVMGYVVFSYITWVEMDIILESFSVDKMSGRIRGVYLALYSMGYFIGPLISTQLLDNFGYESVFTFGVVMNSIFFAFTFMGFSHMRGELRENIGARKLFKKVFSNRDLGCIYLVSFVLEFFYSFMVIYMPLYLLDQGLSWSEIGLILSLIHVPFILLQYPAGILADKKTGEKEMLVLALFIMGSSTASIYFVHSSSVMVWALVLIATRVGASLVEILRDSYFYKKIDKKDIDLIDFFRTSGPVGFILGPILFSTFLIFFSMNAIFVFVGMLVLMGIVPAFILRDNLHEGELPSHVKRREDLHFIPHFLRVLGRRFDVGKIIRTWRF